MNVQELRIGNWFQDPLGNYLQVAGVRSKTIYTSSGSKAYARMRGIPLTPEILEKAGFVQTEDDYRTIGVPQNDEIISQLLVYTNGVFLIDERIVPMAGGTRDVVSIPFKLSSLHQLQNLYFALTGTELSIEL